MSKALSKYFLMEYDGHPLPRYWVVEDIRRPLLPDLDVRLDDIPGKDGQYFLKSNHRAKPIEVDIRVLYHLLEGKKANREKIRRQFTREIRSYLRKKEPKVLRLSDQPQTYDMAILENAEISYEEETALIALSFICPYGVSFTDPVILRSGGSSFTLFYEGDEPAPFLLEGTATGSKVSVFLEGSADRLSILNRKSGEKVRIDTEKEVVYVNEKLAMKDVPAQSDFPWIGPGKQTIKATGLKDIVFTYQGRYL